MLQYMAFVWNESDGEQRDAATWLRRRLRSQAPLWKVALETDGLAVYYYISPGPTLGQAYLLPNKQGVVLGTLFERSYVERSDTDQRAPQKVQFDLRDSTQIVASRGRRLMSDYWGQYVAFLRHPEGAGTWVLRDPSGGVPCEYTELQGIGVYFLRLEDCELLGALRGGINRQYVLGYLMYSSVAVHETGIDSVTSVLAGECVEHSRGRRMASFYWNPLEIAETDVIEDREEATQLLGQTVRGCVHAWASSFDGILHQLSGGLDSTIVLSCLADAPTQPRLVCMNNYTAGTSADERAYARLAAQFAGCELIERERVRLFSLDPLKKAPRALYPFSCLRDPVAAEEDASFAESRGLTGTFTGEGGDEVFYRNGPLPSAVDYAWRHGVRPKLLSIVLDNAAEHALSFWRVLDLAQYYGLRKKPFRIQDSAPSDHRSLIVQKVREAAKGDPSLWHPLYHGGSTIAPMKFLQAYVFSLLAAQGYIPGRLERAPIYLAPLLSQPCMEVALRIPVHVLTSGGQDRAVARRAFAGSIPQAILHRSSKGFDDTYRPAIVAQNIDLVRELLLGGYLAQEGFLNVDLLDQVLNGELTNTPSSAMEVCTYLNVETWARNWCDIPRRAAA